MQYFCISDLHGCYPALEYAIKTSGYNSEDPNHQLISLGDEFGRSETGLGAKGIYDYLTSDRFYNKPIVVRGNHQEMLLDIFSKKSIEWFDRWNGEHRTVASLANISVDDVDIFGPEKAIKKAEKTGVKKWIKSNPFYYKTKNHYMFHGWCPMKNGLIHPNPDKVSNKLWKDSTWAHTENEIANFKFRYPEGYDKTLVFGHWGTHRLRETFPDGKDLHAIWEDKQHKLVGIDQTTYYNSYVNMYIFEDDPE